MSFQYPYYTVRPGALRNTELHDCIRYALYVGDLPMVNLAYVNPERGGL